MNLRVRRVTWESAMVEDELCRSARCQRGVRRELVFGNGVERTERISILLC